MQTVYFTTNNFIRHEGNMVDLTEYRRKLAVAQGCPEMERQKEPRQTCSARTRRHAVRTRLMLDYVASVALIVTALSFAAKIL